jgi:hypothetical protein
MVIRGGALREMDPRKKINEVSNAPPDPSTNRIQDKKQMQDHTAWILHQEDPAQVSQVLYAATQAFLRITPARLARVPSNALQILVDFTKEAARVRELVEHRTVELRE